MCQRFAQYLKNRPAILLPRRACARAAGWLLALTLVAALALAADPEIYLVEYEPQENWILLHFNTDAFRAYAVEYKNSLTATQWTTFTSIPAFPFSNHYVIPDYLTNAQRFYRLRVVN